jgi:ATP-binding cassette subfamily B protein
LLFKTCISSIGLMFRYAPVETTLILIQRVLTSALIPLNIFFTQELLNSMAAFHTEDFNILSLVGWIALLIISMLIVSWNGFFDGTLRIRTKKRIDETLTPVIINKFRCIEYSCFENETTLDTIHRMSNDPQEGIIQLYTNFLDIIGNIISILGTAMIFAQIHYIFVIAFILLIVPTILCNLKSADMMNEMFSQQSLKERMFFYLGSLLSNKHSMVELKIFNASKYISDKWKNMVRDVLDERLKTTIRSQKFYLLSLVLFRLWSACILFFLARSVFNREITIGLFTAIIASMDSIMGRCDTLSRSILNMRGLGLIINHYNAFMSLPEIRRGEESAKIIKNPHIVFEDVCFTYPNSNKEILKGVSFEILPGEKVSLVGENGAGKSTIIKLLCGLYRPDKGKITINGLDIKDMDTQMLQNVFSIVFQDYQNYQLSLRENLALGNISQMYHDEILRAAMKNAMININANNLDIHLGKIEDDGVDISEGQWQRIAIARALVSYRPFMILDEPTASLDPVAESDMYQSFLQVIQDRGCILISHRLASTSLTQKIIVLKDGKVAEIGSREELIAKNGLYARMWTVQSELYEDKEENLA